MVDEKKLIEVEIHNVDFSNRLLDKVWEVLRLHPFGKDCYVSSKATFRTKGHRPHPIIRIYSTDTSRMNELAGHLRKLADVETVKLDKVFHKQK